MNEPKSMPALKLADLIAMRLRGAEAIDQRIAEKAAEAAEAVQTMAEQSPAEPTPEPQAEAPKASAAKPKAEKPKTKRGGGCGCSRNG